MYQLLVVVLLIYVVNTNALYLPGVAPRDYTADEMVELKVNKISSIKTQLPLNYYALPTCLPTGGISYYSENLGEFLQGDRLENSPYDVRFFEQQKCKVTCKRKLNKKEINFLTKVITEEYHNNWYLDGLPAGSLLEDTQVPTGFPIGYLDGKKGKNGIYLYNHVNILIDYHSIAGDAHRIVGFYIEPVSIKHKFDFEWDMAGAAPGEPNTCPSNGRLEQSYVAERQLVEEGEVVYTYGVQWRQSDIRWASRWDAYLDAEPGADRVQWFAIANSVAVVMLLAALVGFITYRSIVNDIKEYNKNMTDVEKEMQREETGWKLVHADVFRPPTGGLGPLLFSVFVGSGMQLLVCTFISIITTVLGFLSPTSRGSILLGMLLLFVLSGAIAGFTSARLYKGFQGRQWQKCTILTATLFPGICFSVFFLLNGLVSSYGSTGAVPVVSMIMMLFLWFGISVPLVFFGAFLAYKKNALEFPCIVSKEPRIIPEIKWYQHSIVVSMAGGLLPFSAMFVELFFVMNSLWTDKYYFLFGFLLIVFLILVLTCAEVSIVMTYFQLCSEDHNWWWRSFATSGATAIYVFLYSVVYFTRLGSSMVITSCLYFGYMSLICIGLFLLTGSIGFFSSLYFNIAIYGSIKVD